MSNFQHMSTILFHYNHYVVYVYVMCNLYAYRNWFTSMPQKEFGLSSLNQIES